MDFELLTIPGCPNTAPAREIFAAALALEGIHEPVGVRELTTEAEAKAFGFRGSPTFRVAGEDLFPATGPFALTCRLYRHGRILSGVPSPKDVHKALRAALAAR